MGVGHLPADDEPEGCIEYEVARDLGITQKAAWHLAHRIRKAWESSTPFFSGPAEVDETYVGGREENKHWSKRKGRRGHQGKAIVVGMKDRPTNQGSMKVIESTDSPTLQGFVRERLEPGATLHTDEHSGYKGLRKDYKHKAVHHSVGDYVLFGAHTNGMESGWAMLKRAYHGTYHHWSDKHLGRYVAEFAGRHNHRPLDTVEQMRRLMHSMDGKRLRYEDLVA